MKNILLALIAIISTQLAFAQYCGFSGPSMCTPSGAYSTPGFFPLPADLPPLVNGDGAGTTLQFHNFDTLIFSGNILKVQSFRIDSIGNLPNGLCWATNKTNNTFGNQEDGCLVFNGTVCANPGQYRLAFRITVTVGTTPPYLPISTEGAAANLFLYLRVNNSGDAVVALDTTGQTAGTNQFIPYGPTADCSPNLSVDLGVNQTACTGSNITLNAVRHGGQSPFAFTWASTGDTLSCTTCEHPQTTITQPGTYSVTVVDATNTSVTGSVSYTLSAGTNTIQFSAANTDIDCTHNIDTTTVTISSGTAPFTVQWGDGTTSTGANTQTHTYNADNTFVVGVTDNSGCVTSLANTINFNGILISPLQLVQPACVGQTSGKIKIGASGGTGPYTYLWSNGATADSIVNVVAGNYLVTVTDAAACSFTKHFNLPPVSGWGFYAYTQPSVSNCSNNGYITTTINGGNAPFSFSWSNGSTTQNLSGLASGYYDLTVTDAAGCQANASVNVPTGCYSLVSGNIFNDLNNNCQLDTGETAVNGIYVKATGSNGQSYFASTYLNGHYTIQIPAAGTFTISAVNYNYTCGNLTLCNNANSTVTIANIGDTLNDNNLGFAGSSGFDLTIHPGWLASNPGFNKDYWIYFGNQSATDFNGQAELTFSYDPNLVYQQSWPAAVNNLNTHTLTWLVDSLNSYYGFWNHEVRCTFYVPQSLPLGYLLQSDFRLSPTVGDCDSSNNVLHVSEIVTGSLDPNEKIVEPAGRILEEDSMLTYTIGFQNTGTDSTHFIIIKDTLSDNLDAGSVRNIASSHPYSEFSISGKGILTWTFNPLRLVDSFTNEKGSHGFVKFTVKKRRNMPIGSIISNKAYIYFDYNPPVITNTVADTVSEPNAIFDLRSAEGIMVRAYPNPFSQATNIVVEGLTQKFDFELYDVTGRLRSRITSVENNQLQLTRDNLSAGVYFFKITSADKKKAGYGKLVIE